ncbi:Cytosolic fatty-acid binding domain and Lipocalin/cytosolic fatty-acid binding domain and Calycin-like domain and Calycin domain-containing protein [Strongyloides ratti]|uniref:Cytosolic fatty-acid binding domain and Lipocalin/cytosolic fatty-acid binding domain and Calycin-like domain and Calycin domain-containing protein n=1 Tax=Strongyloides ratti TaxID=34506 RepID=A0A090KTU2_STRRB|nr:Cytosolic fatty-acid binding domain and Lipocalin/cytosolic fatty-acid binding domain and Calycin-like domain and Calycin domain-containing protein [Strongyloides ratti]CEF60940.1 Cytosolic fatty-acid binding domain and Lipocalin/cytosolic fatty-acid binding domain and Calycin-like domain and Calycin domain-containing protein [Strongyloides ratti]
MPLSDLAGVWNADESINFDEYLKVCGISFLTRKLASKIKPVLTITVDGNNVSINSASTFKNHTTVFKLNEEFEENTIDGRIFKSIFTWANEKLCQKQTAINAEDKPSIIDRYVKEGKLYIDMECLGVKATRTYNKAN